MKIVRHVNTLFFHDGPQLIEAHDDKNRPYLGLLIGDGLPAQRFLFVATTSERLRELLAGREDLRTIFTTEAAQGWFLASADTPPEAGWRLEPQFAAFAESPWLPESGFVLS
jgi:hypothetical protein